MNGAALIEQATFVTERAWEYASSRSSIFNKARAIVAGDGQFFSVAPRIDDLRRSLASESLHDKRDGMKTIVAQMCKGSDMRHFFPDVVKNIHVPSIELRKLIYVFIVYYAEDCPNETLLSISAFQKDLLDPSMHVRALALRMLASLRIPAIQPVVMVAVRKCAADMAPVVRKTAALALVQMHTVARQDLDCDGVRQLLRIFLTDRSPDVVGAAAVAYSHICADEWALVHPVYRRLCGVMKDCDAWDQVVLLRLMVRYARLHFVDPAGPYAARSGDHNTGGRSSSEDGAGSDDDDATSSSRSTYSEAAGGNRAGRATDAAADALIDPDLLLLLNAARQLLRSMNSAVVVAAIALLRHCGTHRFQEACVRPVMRLLSTCAEGSIVVLHIIYALLRQLSRDPFLPYLRSFFVLPLDAADVRHVKLRILAHLVTPGNSTEVYREFRSYLQQCNEAAVVEAVQGLAQVVQQHPPFATHAIRLVTPLLSSATSSPAVVAEAVAVLRLLVLQGTDPVRISRLACQLTLDIMEERVTEPSAVATILWLAGENIARHASMAAAAPDCFRVFAKRFGSLTSEVKREVLTLGCKVWVHLQGNSELADRFRSVYHYVAELAKYDDDYSIRDEERLTEATFDRQSDTFTAVRTTLLRDKPLPDVSDPYAERAGQELGTFSQLLGPSVRGCGALPDWATSPTEGLLRRPIEEINAAAAAVTMYDSSSSAEDESSYTGSDSASEEDASSSASSGSYESSYTGSSGSDDDEEGEEESGADASEESEHGRVAAPASAEATPAPRKSGGGVGKAAASAAPPRVTVRVTMQSAAAAAAATSSPAGEEAPTTEAEAAVASAEEQPPSTDA